MTRRLLLLMIACAACGGRARPPLAPSAVRIAAIEIDGNESIGDGELVGGLALEDLRSKGQELEPYLVQADEDRLRGYYLRRGFFRVQVRSTTHRRGSVAEIRFTIDEGPRARLARVEIVGLPDDPALHTDELRALLRLDDGEPFRYELYELAKPAMLEALKNAGYAHATIDGKVAADRVRAEAIVRVEIDAGPVAYFGAIELRGVEGDLAEAARARLSVREGARYSATALAESQTDLYDMARFSSVRIEPDRSAHGALVPVTITVVESTRHELRIGGGIGINPAYYELRGRAGYDITGWPRPLTTTRVELRPAYAMLRDRDEDRYQPRIEAVASLERIDIFRPFVTGDVEAALSYLTFEAYTSAGPRLRLGVRFPLYRSIVGFAADWQLHVLRFTRVDDALDNATRARIGLDDDDYRLGFYEQRIYVDLRDDPVATRLGIYGELGVEEGTSAAGGELDYLRLMPELRTYVPAGVVVLAMRARLGVIYGEVPVTRRFFAGGASSQRGFPERRLAPTASRLVDGELHEAVYGGAAALEVGAELRAPLTTLRGLELGGVIFLDGADVTETLDELDGGDLQWATGVGLRIATLIGPVRFDVGYRLNRVGDGELRPGEHFAYHLSLGEAF